MDQAVNPVIRPSEHVCAAFGVRAVGPVDMTAIWDGGWRYGDVVLSPVADHARASWSARVREQVTPREIRVARPIRGSDGRYVVSGWRADAYLEGVPEPRFDEILSVAGRLHVATSELMRPRFLGGVPRSGPWSEVDVFTVADAAAWMPDVLTDVRRGVVPEESRRVDVGEAMRVMEVMARLRRPVELPFQVVHGDLAGGVLFAGADSPAITEIVPYYRPAEWASAVVVVDALAWGGADDGLIDRWAHLAEWPQMLLRALIFRLGVHVLHPQSRPAAFVGLQEVVDRLRLLL